MTTSFWSPSADAYRVVYRKTWSVERQGSKLSGFLMTCTVFLCLRVTRCDYCPTSGISRSKRTRWVGGLCLRSWLAFLNIYFSQAVIAFWGAEALLMQCQDLLQWVGDEVTLPTVCRAEKSIDVIGASEQHWKVSSRFLPLGPTKNQKGTGKKARLSSFDIGP